MKLSVSNIAWENDRLEEHLCLLKDLGCDGVEIAPSCIWKEPVNTIKEEIEELRKMAARYSLSIPAIHALLFTRPELYLFGEKKNREDMISYLKKLIGFAGALGTKALIYGSPKSRRVGDKDYAKCYSIAVETFMILAEEASKHDLFFCIEPLGPSECDFILNSDEGFRLVKDVNHLHFGLHLDAKAMIDAREDFDASIKKYAKIIKHFHVGDPGIAPPGNSGFDHSKIGEPLSRYGYDGFISIEMRRGFGESKETIRKAVEYVRKTYFIKGR